MMAIARKPGSKPPPPPSEAAAERFISGAGSPAAPAAETAPERPEDGRRVPTMIRFDAALLARVDAAARRRGVSRAAWVQFVLSQALDAEQA